jgi:hypothetical protein
MQCHPKIRHLLEHKIRELIAGFNNIDEHFCSDGAIFNTCSAILMNKALHPAWSWCQLLETPICRALPPSRQMINRFDFPPGSPMMLPDLGLSAGF